MKIEFLRDFITIKECGSINKAAKKLFITVPGLSRRIKNIEDELDITIFKRNKFGSELTNDGEILYDYAKKINNLYDDCLKQFGKEKVIKIKIGFSFIYDLDTFLSFQTILSDEEINCKLTPVSLDNDFINSTKQAYLKLGNEIDVLLDEETDCKNSDLEYLPIYEDAVCFMVKKGHKLYDKKVIKKEDLNNLKILKLKGDDNILMNELADKIEELDGNITFIEIDGFASPIEKQCEDNEAIFLCLKSIHYNDNDTKIIPLEFTPKIPFSMIYRKDIDNDKKTMIKRMHRAIKRHHLF